MSTTTNELSLRPAKRLLLLYLLGFIVAVSLLGLSFLYLTSVSGMGGHFLTIVWNTIALVGIGFLCYRALLHYTSSYELTNECVTGSIGILSRQTIRIGLSQIVDYRIIRSFTSRLIGIGDLHVDTAGRDVDELIMRNIAIGELNHAVYLLEKLLNIEQHKPNTKVANK